MKTSQALFSSHSTRRKASPGHFPGHSTENPHPEVVSDLESDHGFDVTPIERRAQARDSTRVQTSSPEMGIGSYATTQQYAAERLRLQHHQHHYLQVGSNQDEWPTTPVNKRSGSARSRVDAFQVGSSTEELSLMSLKNKLARPQLSMYHSVMKSQHRATLAMKRQIINSDEEESESMVKAKALKDGRSHVVVDAVAVKRRKRRRVQNIRVLSSEDEDESGLESVSSGTTTTANTIVTGDTGTEMDGLLAKLQTLFGHLDFEELRKALNDSGGRFREAVECVVRRTHPARINALFAQSSRQARQEAVHGEKSKGPKKAQQSREAALFPRLKIQRPLHSAAPSHQGNQPVTLPRSRKALPPQRPASTVQKIRRPLPSPQVYLEVESDEDDENEPSSEDGNSCDEDDDEGVPNRFRAQGRKEDRAFLFFNEATLLELQELAGCSKAQATCVLGLRPFEDYEGLLEVLKRTKGVGEVMVRNYLATADAIRSVDRMLGTVDRVREDLVSTLRFWSQFGGGQEGGLFEKDLSFDGGSKGEDDEPGVVLKDVDVERVVRAGQDGKGLKGGALRGFIGVQPRIMAEGFQLKGYQLIGVNWLALLWRKKLSGILADEMGLGKTAQVITFLAHLLEQGERGPFLIIVPASTLANWLREFQRFCPLIQVQSYYGSQAEREAMRSRLQDQDRHDHGYNNVLVTTYTIATGNDEERKFLNRYQFKGIVLDEGHLVKNCTTARFKQLMRIKAPFRLLLTGTPLQNNLNELLSLLIFIMPKLFAEHEEALRTMVKVKNMEGSTGRTLPATAETKGSEKSMTAVLSQERIARARRMISPFVLRRKKVDVLKDLPKKVEEVVYCELPKAQRAVYDRWMATKALQDVLNQGEDPNGGGGEDDDSSVVVEEEKEASDMAKAVMHKDGKSYNVKIQGKDKKDSVLSLKVGEDLPAKSSSARELSNTLMQLRKAANHPMLFREQYTDGMIQMMAREILKEQEFCDSRLDYVEEDMSVMTDFELYRLCKQYKSLNKFLLPGHPWMEAGKVRILSKLLPTLIHQEHSRILIFSQFTMVLDILESVLQTMELSFLRMDGQTKVEERQGLIDRFNEDQEEEKVHIFLLSTKAGGFGINLTGANVVILYDLDFNPQNDKQAEDRAHRVGQMREVKVIKLLAKDTIEEQIFQLAQLKLTLDFQVSQEDGVYESANAAASQLMGSSRTLASSTGLPAPPEEGRPSPSKESRVVVEEEGRGGGGGGERMGGIVSTKGSSTMTSFLGLLRQNWRATHLPSSTTTRTQA